MDFQKNHIYHLFNQGNYNHKIFFERRNFLFFLEKVKIYIFRYGAILAWYLMPNNFHFMVLIKEFSMLPTSQDLTPSQALTTTPKRSLNDGIGIMLRSYTPAINIQ